VTRASLRPIGQLSPAPSSPSLTETLAVQAAWAAPKPEVRSPGSDQIKTTTDSQTIATTGMLLTVRPPCLTDQRRETAVEWLWVLFMVLMGAIPIALVILAVVLIPRRRKSENADSHVEWWTPPHH
jgi:hypothetical protein